MTLHDEGGPATNGTASRSHNHHSYYDDSAARRRRRDAALRLPPIRCSACAAWIRDPLEHRCQEARWWQPAPEPPCGCYRPDRHGHRNDTCNQLGELSPPRIGPGSRR